MITRIKEIHWWDPKSRQDAITYKVWVQVNDQTELKYFETQAALEAFVSTFKKTKPKVKK